MTQYAFREVSDDDHEFLLNLHNDPLVLRNVTHPTPITLEHHLNWWKRIKNDSHEERLIFTINQQRAGFCKFCYIDRVNNSCVLGADLHADYRGHGHATPMWKMMLDHCFDDLKLFRVSLTTAEYNVPGIKVYTKLGFLPEGKLTKSLKRDGVYYDQLLYYMTIDTRKEQG